MRIRIIFPLLCLLLLASWALAQDLGEAARKERERQAALKQKGRVYTNADIARSHPPETKQKEEPGSKKSAANDRRADLKGHDEQYWSEKFLAAKKRVADAEEKQAFIESRLKDYNYKLQNQTDVYDREHLYFALIQEAKEEQTKNSKELADAKAALDDLYREFRESGAPLAWAESTRAQQSTPPERPSREYFLKRLQDIEDQYEARERSYKEERFRLMNRRQPTAQDILDAKEQNYALGLDPSIKTLDEKINEIEKKHQQARTELISQAQVAGFTIP